MTYITDTEKEFARKHIEAMNEIIGEDITGRGRGICLCWGRYIVGSVLMGKGIRPSHVATIFGFNHSSMPYWREMFQNILAYPQLYRAERELYDKFIAKASDIRMEDIEESIEKEIEIWTKKDPIGIKEYSEAITKWGKSIARHFYNIGKESHKQNTDAF